jgi:4-oxalocrotonate tautomerase
MVHMLAGREPQTKKELIRRLTAAVTETLAVPPEQVRVLLNEVAPEHWGVAGLPIDEYRRTLT